MEDTQRLFERTVDKLLKGIEGTDSSKKKPKKVHDEDEGNTVGGGALGPAAAVGHSQSGDWYAPGDYRVPKALGAIQTRNGAIGRKRRKKKKKK